MGLGTFIEVESTSSKDKIFDEVVLILRNSDFAIPDDTHAGYLDLILKTNNKIRSKTDFETLFNNDNRWKVRPNEQDIFLAITRFK